MTHRQTYFFALIFLATVTACVVPGLATPTAPSLFAPTTDPSRLETMVAETVSAAIAETEQARPEGKEAGKGKFGGNNAGGY